MVFILPFAVSNEMKYHHYNIMLFTWYQAQTICAEAGSHLTTLEEIMLIHAMKDLSIHKYWLGLHYHPWVWIINGEL